MNTPTAGPIGQLSRAIGVTAQVIDGLGPKHWGAPTPCTDWTVRDLVGHLTRGNWLFASALRGTDGVAGQPGPAAPDADRAETDRALPAEFRASAGLLLDAFAEPGALERIVTVPFGPWFSRRVPASGPGASGGVEAAEIGTGGTRSTLRRGRCTKGSHAGACPGSAPCSLQEPNSHLNAEKCPRPRPPAAPRRLLRGAPATGSRQRA
ncbi:MAG: maleylpyruvate isomerase family mycothiol-dependent enzyme [Streptosporangiaceae bacterium]